MSPCVIDNMVLAQLAQLQDRFNSWNWPDDLLKVPKYMASSEASGDPKREICLQQPWIEIIETPVEGMAASFIATELTVNGECAVDQGELHGIGVAKELGLPFATADKNGLFLAAAVLDRGKAILPYDLWLELRRSGLIAAAEQDRLSALTWRNHKQLVLRQPARTRT